MADPDGGSGGVRRLVIVESPTKARKIAGYLGSNYVVESSRGHIRDLPRAAADVPAKYKSEPWARLGVNVDADFEPLYIISPEKKSTVAELKDLLKGVDELYLATDGDREGEAIAWHLLETLKPRIPVKRMVFHEITESAIQAAANDPRDLDIDLVDAQETRRILDRLYGYEVSPVLWKKIAPKLSAGRVQSVATRIIVSRERERMAFRTAGYWDVTAELDASVSDAEASPPKFTAKLNTVDGKRVASGRDFDSLGVLRKPDEVRVLDESSATALAGSLRGAQLSVTSVEQKPYTRRPYPPFMTSTLQQEAGRKLRFSSERTMSIAQRLYENGYITYMRTDSTTLSETAINAARNQARQLYGEEYVHPTARQYTRKVKNAQEAHEAVRPSGDVFQTPGQLHSRLDNDEFRLYELIWQRTVASQMADARGTTLSLRIAGTAGTGQLHGENGAAEVSDTQKDSGYWFHTVTITAGQLAVGDTVDAEIDSGRRFSIQRNHTTTHLLHKALQTVLGSHVQQRGSLVAPDRLRFDFSHDKALSGEEARQVEGLVNEKILDDLAIHTFEKPIAEAKEMGATMLFGEKYGDIVRVVEAGDYSLEFCGGTHLAHTSQAGLFKITAEGSSQAGVRRIEAVTGKRALMRTLDQERLLSDIAASLKTSLVNAPASVEKLQADLKQKERELNALQKAAAGGQVDALLAAVKTDFGFPLVVHAVKGNADGDTLRTLADEALNKLKSGVVILAGTDSGKVSLAVRVSKDLVARGVHAGNIVKTAAPIVGGGGGGRPDAAQAGGKDPSRLAEALAAAERLVGEMAGA